MEVIPIHPFKLNKRVTLQFGGINYVIAALIVSYSYFQLPSYGSINPILAACYGYLFLTGAGLLIYGFIVREPETFISDNCPNCNSNEIKVKINQKWTCPSCNKTGEIHFEKK